jgi:TonB family protein
MSFSPFSAHSKYLGLIPFGIGVCLIAPCVSADNENKARDVTKYAIFAPYPEYPIEARRHWLTGSGVVVLELDQRTGLVTSAVIAQSTGHKILDNAALKAFQIWRFKPGKVATVKVPVDFTMANALGAVYAPRPAYPYAARARHLTGSGVALLELDPRTGNVTSAHMLKSTGHQILDDCALAAFRQWRFKLGTESPVKVPITHTMIGAKH